MQKQLIIAAIFLGSSVATHAADWRVVGGSDDMLAYVDASSIAPTGSYRKAWFWFEYQNPQTEGVSTYPKKSYLSAVQQNYYNCSERSAATKQTLMYAGKERNGETIANYNFPSQSLNFIDPIPGSVGESMLNFVCSKKTAK